MKAFHWIGLLLVFGALALVGCQQQTPKQTNNENSGANQGSEHQHSGHNHADKADAKIKAALAKLSPEDRKLAEAQKSCPISGDLLGSMGKPLKVMVKDQPVFLCCDGCEKGALADPEKTLAKVKELKAQNQK
jgi:hypothetical protein